MKNTLCLIFVSLLIARIAINAQSVENSVRINELMATNTSTITDKDSDYSDCIELFNPTGSSVNLDGRVLTDVNEDLEK